MGFPDILALVVIAAVLGVAIAYIVRAKKKGQRCIGCPYSDCCKKDCTQDKKDT